MQTQVMMEEMEDLRKKVNYIQMLTYQIKFQKKNIKLINVYSYINQSTFEFLGAATRRYKQTTQD